MQDNTNSPYQTNQHGKPAGYFGFFTDDEPGIIYFGTGYEEDCMDDGEPEAVNEELSDLLSTEFPNIEIAMTESSHGIRCKEDEKEQIINRVKAILGENGWKPFKE